MKSLQNSYMYERLLKNAFRYSATFVFLKISEKGLAEVESAAKELIFCSVILVYYSLIPLNLSLFCDFFFNQFVIFIISRVY